MWRAEWLLLGIWGLGCGGITERHVETSAAGSPASAGAPSHAAGGSTAMSQGGNAPSSGGNAAPSSGGTGVVTMPPVDEPTACFADTDCPNPACGGEVCNWTKMSPVPNGVKMFVCNPAGTQSRMSDGWCTTDADCKCRGLGAKCNTPYCSFTRAEDGP